MAEEESKFYLLLFSFINIRFLATFVEKNQFHLLIFSFINIRFLANKYPVN